MKSWLIWIMDLLDESNLKEAYIVPPKIYRWCSLSQKNVCVCMKNWSILLEQRVTFYVTLEDEEEDKGGQLRIISEKNE